MTEVAPSEEGVVQPTTSAEDIAIWSALYTEFVTQAYQNGQILVNHSVNPGMAEF